MKKNLKILVAVAAVIVLLCGGIIALLNTEAPSDEDTPTAAPVQQYEAYKIDRADAAGFVIHLDGEDIAFKNTGNGTWSMNGTPYEELDASKTESLLMSVFTMMSNNEIEKDAQDMAKYGFDVPTAVIEIDRVDGGRDKLLIGDLSPVLGEYFFTVDGSGDVYSLYSYKVDTILKPSSYYKTYDRFNPVTNDITDIKLVRRGADTLELRLKDINGEEDGYSVAWEVVQPYKKVFNGIDQFIDDKILTKIGELVISAPADEGRNYGFDDPSAEVTITVEPYNEADGTRGEAETLSFIAGNSENGITYVKYDGKAYAVTSADLEFVYTDAFLAVSKLQAIVDIQNTDKVTVTTPQDTTVMEINHGAQASDMTFKVNGKDADEKLSKKVYQSIIALNIDAFYEGEPVGDTVAEIEFRGYGGAPDVKVELKELNELNCALVRDGETYFVIKRSKVDEMLAQLREYVQDPSGE